MKLVDQGRLGQKSGSGWYRYEPGERKPLRDPEVEAFIVAESARLGIERQPISEEEILKRCLYGMINEGAKLLEQGIALRASDIDVVYVTGYGFPADRGGPDVPGRPHRRGVDLRGRASASTTQHGSWWEPAPLLERLARKDGKFLEGAVLGRARASHRLGARLSYNITLPFSL